MENERTDFESGRLDMQTKTEMTESLLIELLDCWTLDLKYLIELLQKAESRGAFDDALDMLKGSRQTAHPTGFNGMVYRVFDAMANAFIKTLPDCLQDRAHNTKAIYCNFIDSRLRFDDDEVQDLWENSHLYM